MHEEKSREIVSYCESLLERHGDCHLGVGWTRGKETADARYEAMLGVIKEPRPPVSLLDFGCGASHLYEYLLHRGTAGIAYSGLDLSARFLELSRKKHPNVTYYHTDILREPGALPDFDYVVLNGVFTSKRRFSQDEMESYLQAVVSAVFEKARVGIAFNVISKLVDWEREDLFHLSFDALGRFLAARVSRNFVIRHDYGLYEYTAYVYR
jgi:SAM-dependent methyltransferase